MVNRCDGRCGLAGTFHVHGESNPDDSLTFAEAMALDPSEVEVRWAVDSDVWYRMDAAGVEQATLGRLRGAHFRRSRPKRSRVQEMANGKFDFGRIETQEQVWMTYAIRAVCEFVRSLKLGYRDHDDEVAGRIEREFLEPRR